MMREMTGKIWPGLTFGISTSAFIRLFIYSKGLFSLYNEDPSFFYNRDLSFLYSKNNKR